MAVAATFTASPLSPHLARLSAALGRPMEVRLAAHDQLFQELLTPKSLLRENTRGVDVLLLRFEDWQRVEHEDAARPVGIAADRADRLPTLVDDLVRGIAEAATTTSVPILVVICPASLGAIAAGLGPRYDLLEEGLEQRLRACPTVGVVRSVEVRAAFGDRDPDDPRRDRLAHLPYVDGFYEALAALLLRRLHAIESSPIKVIAVDCDGTLWSGVCGEDGPDGVVVDAPRIHLQRRLVELEKSGVVLALVSKNIESDVVATFRAQPTMPLTLGHVLARKIGWGPKSSAIRELAAELGFGLDSFVFIDDNAVECAEVEAACPDVTVLRLPDAPADIPAFLGAAWVLDRGPTTTDDLDRGGRLREEVSRSEAARSAPTLEAFLASLEMRFVFEPMQLPQLVRVASLTHRTNQFNTSLVRRTEAEIQAALASGTLECFVAEVSDRFGDYGLVGVVLTRVEGGTLEVDTMLLSCRALGRRVEHRMLAALSATLRQRGLGTLRIPFTKGPRNQPAEAFLSSLGGTTRPTAAGFEVEIASTNGEADETAGALAAITPTR